MPKSDIKRQPLPENKNIPTKEDIRAVLKVAGTLERALILVGCSAGLAAADLCNLKVSDFENGYNPTDGITTLKLRRVKTGFDYVT